MGPRERLPQHYIKMTSDVPNHNEVLELLFLEGFGRGQPSYAPQYCTLHLLNII